MEYSPRTDPADNSVYLYMHKPTTAAAADFKNGYTTYLTSNTIPHHVRFSFASGSIDKEDTNLRIMLLETVILIKFYFNSVYRVKRNKQ